jgi:hypothetical protein
MNAIKQPTAPPAAAPSAKFSNRWRQVCVLRSEPVAAPMGGPGRAEQCEQVGELYGIGNRIEHPAIVSRA